MRQCKSQQWRDPNISQDKSKLEILQQQQARFWLEDPILFNNRALYPHPHKAYSQEVVFGLLVKTPRDKSKLEILQQQQARFWLEDPVQDVFNNRRSIPYMYPHPYKAYSQEVVFGLCFSIANISSVGWNRALDQTDASVVKLEQNLLAGSGHRFARIVTSHPGANFNDNE